MFPSGAKQNQMGTRVLDDFSHKCPVLPERLKAVMEPQPVYDPERELTEMFGVTPETIQAWRLCGAPVGDLGELAERAMKEPGTFQGFIRTQEAADTPEAIEEPEMEGEIRDALAGWRASPMGRAWKRVAACWVRRLARFKTISGSPS